VSANERKAILGVNVPLRVRGRPGFAMADPGTVSGLTVSGLDMW
jgi:hypothetical protein